jgi:response regulator of citrate/malate metabolism
MADWRVLVVEDDRVVANLHRRFVSRVRGFEVIGVAGTAAQAELAVRTLRPDLILLDIGLPGQSGLDLLRRLRAAGDAVEVIAVTAATATGAVRAAVQLGAVDYVVKPFDLDRLRKSLGLFQRRMAMLTATQLAQEEVDRICSDGPNAYRWLPRDLSGARLEEIRASLANAAGPTTAARVAAEVGIARVTARRYLEYLVTIGQATMEPVAIGPGRPRKTYRFVPSAVVESAAAGAGAR